MAVQNQDLNDYFQQHIDITGIDTDRIRVSEIVSDFFSKRKEFNGYPNIINSLDIMSQTNNFKMKKVGGNRILTGIKFRV